MKWPLKRLAELGVVSTGSTPSTTETRFYGGDLPFVTPAELDTGLPVTTATRTLTEEGAAEARPLPEGTVMVCCIGSLGKIGIAGRSVATNQQINSVVFDRNQVWPKYGYYACRLLKPKMECMAPATTLPIISKSKFAELEIPLPPLAEQRRIAEVLDRAEALRAKRRAALAEFDSLTQSLFLDLFGDPAANPKQWPQVRLSDLFAASPIFGTMIPPSVDGGSWLSLRVGNIQDWQLDLSDQKFVELPLNTVERHAVKDGDMLMARAIASQDHLGKAVIVHPGEQKWAFDSHLMRLRFNQSKALPEVIRHLLMTPGGRSLFLKAARRTAVQFNINTKEMAALNVPLPPIALQQEFARRVGAVEKLKQAQRAALAEQDALFATLQHRAFRGEL